MLASKNSKANIAKTDSAPNKVREEQRAPAHETEQNPLWSNIATHLTSRADSSPPNTPPSIQRLCAECEEEQNRETIQTQLTVSAPDDEYEREANEVADTVMRMPEDDSVAGLEEPSPVQTTPLSNSKRVQRLCSKCEQEVIGGSSTLQGKTRSTYSEPAVSQSVSIANKIASPGSGSPLPTEMRSRIERVLGTDLSHVRIHSDENSRQAATDIQAKAFTHRNHIYLGTGQSSTDTKLMAHEATHVVQQGAGRHLPNIQRTVRESPRVHTQPGAQVAMVHLHGDERNALETALYMFRNYCANLVHLDSTTRCVTVDIPGTSRPCTADPNRIFSSASVTRVNAFNLPCACPARRRNSAVTELHNFRDNQLLPAIDQIRSTDGEQLPVVTFHNNTPGRFSIRSYQPRGSEAGATETDPALLGGRTNPSIRSGEDPDNFYLVTQLQDYDVLVGSRNVVLQSGSPHDDGSLSVALRGQRYINVEAEGKRYRGNTDPAFATNRTMAEELFRHMGVSRRPCQGALSHAPSTEREEKIQREPEDRSETSGDRPEPSTEEGLLAFVLSLLRRLWNFILRLLRELNRVAGQERTRPAALPRESPPGNLPRGCLTFANQAALDVRKSHWDGVIAGMNIHTVVDWIIGVSRPPPAVGREMQRQRDCMLHALGESARRRGTTATTSSSIPPYRNYRAQEGIWNRKFNFRGRPFDRISANARTICGSLLLASETQWNPAEPRHRVCWGVAPIPGTTVPAMPAGARALTPDERQREILQASSAPGISRHHWGTDVDLFSVEPVDWESGARFADEYSWLQRNASTYGFLQSFTSTSTFMRLGYMEERWHWSYYPISQALLEFARAHQGDIQTSLMRRWGRSGQFSFIRSHWREFMFNVNERARF